MKRKTAFILFLLLIAALVMAGDAWRRINSMSMRDYDIDEVVRPLRQQMNELRGEIQDLHKLYMKQWAALEQINEELNTQTIPNDRTTETRILTEPVKDRAEETKIAAESVLEEKTETRIAAVPLKEKKVESARPVIEKKTAGADVKATVAQQDNSAEKLLSEFVESMTLQQPKTDVKADTKAATFAAVDTKPVEQSGDSRKKIVFKANANGTLKPKKDLSTDEKRPPKAAQPAKVAVNSETRSAGSSNLPPFLDINSLVSTTATAAVTAENKTRKDTKPAEEKTERKTAETASVPRRPRDKVVEADPTLPGATPVRVEATKETTPGTTAADGKALVSRTMTGRRRVKAVTPEDLRPNPPKRVAKTEPKAPPDVTPETRPGADTLVIDLQEKPVVAKAGSRVIADVDEKKTIPDITVTAETAPAPVAPKRVTSVPAQTAEPETELADLRPSQLYKQRKKAAEIMRVSMTDHLSPQVRSRVKKTMADVLEEYNAMTE